MPSALALALAVALGVDARVETGVFTEARGRRLDPAPTPARKDALDLSVTPHLRLGVTGGLGSLSATYAPRLTASDVGPDLRWEHMHEGELRLRLGSGPVWSAEGFWSGGLGRTNLVTENRGAASGNGGGTGGGTGPTTISTVNAVDLERQRAGLALRLAPDRRTEVVLSGAVSEDGGTTQASRAVLPVARGAEAGLELRWSATRLDQLGVRLAAARTRIAAYPTDAAWASALATWRRHVTPQLELWSGAGAVALQSKAPRAAPLTGRGTQRLTRPAAELGLARTAGEPAPVAGQSAPGAEDAPPIPIHRDLTGRVAATLGASVDRLTGVATPQLEVRAELRWPLAPSLSVVGRGTGALAWPDTGRARRGQLELAASIPLAPRALIDLGAYGAWQNSDDPAVPDLSEYGAFLRLALDAPPLSY